MERREGLAHPAGKVLDHLHVAEGGLDVLMTGATRSRPPIGAFAPCVSRRASRDNLAAERSCCRLARSRCNRGRVGRCSHKQCPSRRTRIHHRGGNSDSGTRLCRRERSRPRYPGSDGRVGTLPREGCMRRTCAQGRHTDPWHSRPGNYRRRRNSRCNWWDCIATRRLGSRLAQQRRGPGCRVPCDCRMLSIPTRKQARASSRRPRSCPNGSRHVKRHLLGPGAPTEVA
jgi:hypothetical protein